jgi:hypothetical protein
MKIYNQILEASMKKLKKIHKIWLKKKKSKSLQEFLVTNVPMLQDLMII